MPRSQKSQEKPVEEPQNDINFAIDTSKVDTTQEVSEIPILTSLNTSRNPKDGENMQSFQQCLSNDVPIPCGGHDQPFLRALGEEHEPFLRGQAEEQPSYLISGDNDTNSDE